MPRCVLPNTAYRQTRTHRFADIAAAGSRSCPSRPPIQGCADARGAVFPHLVVSLCVRICPTFFLVRGRTKAQRVGKVGKETAAPAQPRGMRMRQCLFPCVFECLYVFVCVCVFVCRPACVRACTHALYGCIYEHAYMYVQLYVGSCVYTHSPTVYTCAQRERDMEVEATEQAEAGQSGAEELFVRYVDLLPLAQMPHAEHQSAFLQVLSACTHTLHPAPTLFLFPSVSLPLSHASAQELIREIQKVRMVFERKEKECLAGLEALRPLLLDLIALTQPHLQVRVNA